MKGKKEHPVSQTGWEKERIKGKKERKDEKKKGKGRKDIGNKAGGEGMTPRGSRD